MVERLLCMQKAQGSIPCSSIFAYLSLAKTNKKKVEEQGIDPCASRMLSVRSTI